MGACASIPKSMKGEAALPEPAQEEQVVKAVDESTTIASTNVEEVKVEQEDKKDDETNKQSLGSLLKEEEATVEEAAPEKPKEEAPEKPKEEVAVAEAPAPAPASVPEKEPQEEKTN